MSLVPLDQVDWYRMLLFSKSNYPTHSLQLTRSLQGKRQRHIWLIDHQAAAIGTEMHTDLGDWIKWRLHHGVQEQGRLTQDQIEEYGIDVEELESQWASQKESQLSVQSRKSFTEAMS